MVSRKLVVEAVDSDQIKTNLSAPTPSGHILSMLLAAAGGKAKGDVSRYAFKLSKGATSGNYVKKKELDAYSDSIPLLNTLCYIASFLLVKKNKCIEQNFLDFIQSPGDKTVTFTGDPSPTKVSDMWNDLISDAATKSKLDVLFDLLETQKEYKKYLETASTLEPPIVFTTLANKLNEPDESPGLNRETLIGMNPIKQAISYAIAAHFNDTQNQNPVSSYESFLNVLYQAPKHASFIFNDNADIGGNVHASTFKGGPVAVTVKKVLTNFAADDPINKQVHSNLEEVSQYLLNYAKLLYSQFKEDENAETVVDRSAVTAPKTHNMSTIDSGAVVQVYNELLHSGFNGKEQYEALAGPGGADASINGITIDPKRVARLQQISINTLKDLMEVEKIFGFAGGAQRIVDLLVKLTEPIQPASLLGLTKSLKDAFKPLGDLKGI